MWSMQRQQGARAALWRDDVPTRALSAQGSKSRRALVLRRPVAELLLQQWLGWLPAKAWGGLGLCWQTKVFATRCLYVVGVWCLSTCCRACVRVSDCHAVWRCPVFYCMRFDRAWCVCVCNIRVASAVCAHRCQLLAAPACTQAPSTGPVRVARAWV